MAPALRHGVITGERPRILIFGARGQVGWELMRALAPLGTIQAFDRDKHDIGDLDSLRSIVRGVSPTVIANAAAYTAVDKAETQRDVVFRVNTDVPVVLAGEAKRLGALLVHFSTDYVFDGGTRRPYTEKDPARPLNVYGQSKLAGDQGILESGAAAYVFRVSWVYGARRVNFLRTIQRLARESAELRVVSDQHGAPTWCRAIAQAVAPAVARWLTAPQTLLQVPRSGVYHMAAPDYTTWHQFASEIVSAMPQRDGRSRPTVRAIGTSDYPTDAVRPSWSVMDSGLLRQEFALELPAWREQLRMCLEEMSPEQN